jgi:hypothetical protein
VKEPLLLTEEQAAERLLMRPRTLRKLRQEGAIRYVALTGRRVAYRPEDCEAFVEAQSRIETPQVCPTRRSVQVVGKRRHGNIVPFSIRQGNRG